MPSQPAAEKDEPVAAPGGEEDEPGFGFDTPEEAVAAYLAGLKNGDLEEMLAACAVGVYVGRRDTALVLSRYGEFPPFLRVIPSSNSFLWDVNFEIRRTDLTRMIALQYVTLLIPQLDVTYSVKLQDEEAVAAIVALFGGEAQARELSSLTILEVTKGSEWKGTPEHYHYEGNMTDMERRARSYGVDGHENIVAVFRFDGRDYAFFPMVGRYDDKWLIVDLIGNVGNLLRVPVQTGGLMKMD